MDYWNTWVLRDFQENSNHRVRTVGWSLRCLQSRKNYMHQQSMLTNASSEFGWRLVLWHFVGCGAYFGWPCERKRTWVLQQAQKFHYRIVWASSFLVCNATKSLIFHINCSIQEFCFVHHVWVIVCNIIWSSHVLNAIDWHWRRHHLINSSMFAIIFEYEHATHI